jgi:hypothetical protein
MGMKIFRQARAAMLVVLCCGAAWAQDVGACGVVDAVQFPVDPRTYQMVQGYGVPSFRHQGRYHSGEDWYGGPQSVGAPVAAIAAGRVTYSSPSGWGRDGGVVIVEHTMPDESVYYSLYGHIAERGDIQFPARYSCVTLGQVIGAIADVRPAPHLHWELRDSRPDIPGAGYEWQMPQSLGLLEPSRFITEWSAWLTPSVAWQLARGVVTAPLVLEDNSMIVSDGVYLRRILNDGRILWRATQPASLVDLIAFQRSTLALYSDGALTRVNVDDGAAVETIWLVGVELAALPLSPTASGTTRLYNTADGGLVLLDMAERAIVWQLADAGGPFVRGWASAGGGYALQAADGALSFVSAAGEVQPPPTAPLSDVVSLSANGADFVAYTRGGVWDVRAGAWALRLPDAPMGTNGRAVLSQSDGLWLFDGSTLTGYDSADGVRAQIAIAALPQAPVASRTDMRILTGINGGEVLLLHSVGGDVLAVSLTQNAVCNRLTLWPTATDAVLWAQLGADGLLRVTRGDVLFALAWDEWTKTC